MRKAILLLACTTLIGCNHYEPITLETPTVVEATTSIELVEESTVNIYEVKQRECELELESISGIENQLSWFIEYKRIIDKYSEWINPPETIYDVYSTEEIRYMLKCIETETYQQNFIPKVNVANVILNRVNNERFPSNPIEVITSPKQFAYGRDNIADDTVLALEYAFMMEDTSQGALFFHSFKEASPRFSGADYLFTDEAGHHFYK